MKIFVNTLYFFATSYGGSIPPCTYIGVVVFSMCWPTFAMAFIDIEVMHLMLPRHSLIFMLAPVLSCRQTSLNSTLQCVYIIFRGVFSGHVHRGVAIISCPICDDYALVDVVSAKRSARMLCMLATQPFPLLGFVPSVLSSVDMLTHSSFSSLQLCLGHSPVLSMSSIYS